MRGLDFDAALAVEAKQRPSTVRSFQTDVIFILYAY